MAELGMWRAEPRSGALSLKLTEGTSGRSRRGFRTILGVRDVLLGVTGHDPKSLLSDFWESTIQRSNGFCGLKQKSTKNDTLRFQIATAQIKFPIFDNSVFWVVGRLGHWARPPLCARKNALPRFFGS